MSTLDAWMRGREPAPPEPLAAALGSLGGTSRVGVAEERGQEGVGVGLPDVLAGAARARLELALARPGRDRESAYRLLEADALFTYACEAAVERGDASAALKRVLALASG